MKNKFKIFFFSCSILLLLFFYSIVKQAGALAPYPTPHNYINDNAGVLNQQTEDSLNKTLAAFEKRTTNQIGVLTIQTIGDESIEEYGIHLADKWKFGQKGKDNGVIILFAMDERKMRIEVGRGLEGELTDIESKHILDDEVKPEFKAGNYDAGVTKAVVGVIRTIDPTASEAGKIASTSATITSNGDGLVAGIIIVIFIIFLILLIIGIVLAVDGDDDTSLGIALGAVGGAIADGVEEVGDSDSGGGFGGGGGGGFSGGGASSGW